MKREFITVKEASEITGLSPHSVRKRVERGVFKALQRSSPKEKLLIYRESVYVSKNGDG